MSIKRRKLIQGIHHLKQEHDKTDQYQVISSSNRVFKCCIQIWKNYQFRKYYPNLNVKEIVKDFDQCVELPNQIMGKKSSEIVISSSKKYCLKMITEEDLKQFDSILDQYNQFNQAFKNKSSLQSYFVDIYQVFLVHSKDGTHSFTDIYILMPNIRVQQDKTICVFDIKGHCDGRSIKGQDFINFKYGKDQNFIESKQLNLLKTYLSKQNKQNLIKAISIHTHFLNKISIIDYSLLLVIYLSQQKPVEESQEGNKFPSSNGIQIKDDIWMRWRIIDFFQVYNKKKQMENKFKSVFRKTVSSVDPQTYEKRLLEFLQTQLL